MAARGLREITPFRICVRNIGSLYHIKKNQSDGFHWGM